MNRSRFFLILVFFVLCSGNVLAQNAIYRGPRIDPLPMKPKNSIQDKSDPKLQDFQIPKECRSTDVKNQKKCKLDMENLNFVPDIDSSTSAYGATTKYRANRASGPSYISQSADIKSSAAVRSAEDKNLGMMSFLEPMYDPKTGKKNPLAKLKRKKKESKVSSPIYAASRTVATVKTRKPFYKRSPFLEGRGVMRRPVGCPGCALPGSDR